MRQFSYSFDGQEVSFEVLSASEELLVTAKFPTPMAIRDLCEQEVNRLLLEAGLPELTNKELVVCRNTVQVNNPE